MTESFETIYIWVNQGEWRSRSSEDMAITQAQIKAHDKGIYFGLYPYITLEYLHCPDNHRDVCKHIKVTISSEKEKVNMYEMYSEEGNQAVKRALSIIDSQVPNCRNRRTLEAMAQPILKEVAILHSEVYDTEPRGHIADHLDGICQREGWSYDRYEGYDW